MSDKPTIDFNHHTPEYSKNWRQMIADFHQRDKPLAWTEAHDGFWVLADHAACVEVLSNWRVFTSYNDLEGTGNGGQGQMIPRFPYRLDLGESDPPLHTERRSIETPFFTPKLIRRWGQMAQEHVDEQIDLVIEKGELDLIKDVCMATAARTTLRLVGYEGDWEEAADAAHKMSFLSPADPNYPYQQLERMRVGFRSQLLSRRAAPVGDVISALATGTVEGRPMTDAEGESMLNALVLGGFDTTTSTSASVYLWLQRHKEHIPRFLEDAKFRRNLVEEVLRCYGPSSGMSRTAVEDTVLLGQTIKKGERVFCWFHAANHDPKVFVDPNKQDPERANADLHLTFSAGEHRCLGSQLAKIEVEIIVCTLLRRLPDMEVTNVVRYAHIGAILGYQTISARFTPGKPLQPLSQAA
ncbi:cytochrome P450 [Herbaspirillum seropedicae]|uniref:cytochrome P450 n=1 Tax=Herbaspirillum seropedicae TaxID=964 RepID=UPI002858DC00|nr:cytochrome P450 [Herbaspirillum seropedicae]MDR6397517.1 cytochrome P450 [Herbaspirillum seropedicae]